MDPGVRRDDTDFAVATYAVPKMSNASETQAQASPSVSNIAAAIASCVDLPAHTTNWNAGK